MAVQITPQEKVYQPRQKVVFKGTSPALSKLSSSAAQSLLEQPAVENSSVPSRFTMGTKYQPKDIDKTNQIKVDPRLLAVYHIKQIASAQNVDIPSDMVNPSLSRLLGIVKGDALSSKAVDARGNKRGGGDWMSNVNMHNLFVRSDTAWDSNNDGKVEVLNSDGVNESGTFTKAIAILPELKKMKRDCLYLNPINQIGQINRKSNAGSPYAIRDFYELNSDLDDPQIKTTVDQEFKAFMDAAHKNNMRVMLDFVFRLVSYDNVLLVDKPQWSQWHTMGSNPKVCNTAEPNKETMEAAMKEAYVAKFGKQPEKKIVQRSSQTSDKAVNPDELTWKEAGLTPKDIITQLREKHHVEPIQAGPPDPNDPQVWSDVTFLRTMEEPNGNKDLQELWDYLENIIPYYQKQYGIDGARIDMAHNLHPVLKQRIMDKAREVDPDFAFFAEDFCGEYNVFWGGDGRKVEENKLFNAACGNIHYVPTDNPNIGAVDLKNAEAGYMWDWSQNKAKWSDGLVWGTPETHDSGRATRNQGGILHSKASYTRHAFYPKVFPTTIGGFELGETESKKAEDRDSALFSYYPLKAWANQSEKDKAATVYENGENVAPKNISDYIAKVSEIREKYMDVVTDNHSDSYMPIGTGNSPIAAYARVPLTKRADGTLNDKALLVVQNMDMWNEQSNVIDKGAIRHIMSRFAPGQNVDNMNLKLHDELTGATYDYNTSTDLYVKLKRGQSHIFSIKKP